MTPRCAARLVRRWVRAYTRRLPDPIADRRFAELDADLHDQIAHGRARGVPELRIAAAILSRAVRGLPDDASWRRASVPRRRPTGPRSRFAPGLRSAFSAPWSSS